jgi:hypothetical protein
MVSLPWDEPGWLEGVRTWIENELARVGRPATGPIEILHRRAWSAFAQIPTDGGPIYFKASAPALLFEAGLTAALRRWHPELTVPLLAVDAERGWMLTADAGPTLRSQLHRPEDLRRLDPLLQRYAVLQGGLVRRVPEMLAMGVPDRRSERLPGLYDELLGDTSALRLGLDGGMTPEQHRRLKALRPRFADECAQLAEAGPPDTLVHEEIHSGNILVTPSGELLTDWGDSCLAHPFVSILVMLRSAAWWLDVPETHPEVQRLRDVYLEAWTSHAPRHALHAVLATAYRVAMVVRSLAYQAILGPLAESYRIENDAIQGWLVDYLESEEGGRAKEQ